MLARAALWSGSVGSLVTAAVLAYWGRRERGAAVQPVNAPSHWLWRGEALAQRGFTLRHTIPGYLIHHGSSVFWAVFFEHLLLDRPPNAARAAAAGLGVAAVAAGVDLKLTPQRLTPGFERHLSGKALTVMYAAFGVALFAAHQVARRRAGQARRS
jgi:hypothetical protein